MAADGQLELKLLVCAADFEPLILTGDLSDDDLTTPARLAAALDELLPDMVRHYAGRVEEPRGEPKILYALPLPGSRTRLGEATAADLELARHHLRDQASELACWDGWLRAIGHALATGKTVREAFTLEQLRMMRHLSRPR